MTEWRPVLGYEGRYDVSDDGRVRSWLNPARSREKFAREPHELKAISGRYLNVVLCGENGRRTWAIHQLVALAFLGPTRGGQEIRHLNGDAHDCRVENLAFGSHAENMQDAKEHGVLWMVRQAERGWRKPRAEALSA